MHWECPYCGRAATIRRPDMHIDTTVLAIENAEGPRYFRILSIVCPNRSCRRFTLQLSMSTAVRDAGIPVTYSEGDPLKTWQLLPPARMKVMPLYVPRPIVEDYEEACKILELSPKAAATLARRALQGMIRDFWEIRRDKLIDEIGALKEKVDLDTWAAIDAVRSVGNIGAHMERDIDLIIDVEPGEAEKLIWLIEFLVKEWYVTRHERGERLKEIKEIADAKDKERKSQTGQ